MLISLFCVQTLSDDFDFFLGNSLVLRGLPLSLKEIIIILKKQPRQIFRFNRLQPDFFVFSFPREPYPAESREL